MLRKIQLFSCGFLAAGFSFAIAGFIIGRATRLAIQYFFSDAVPDQIISIERIPFFVAGGTFIAIGVGIIMLLGDK